MSVADILVAPGEVRLVLQQKLIDMPRVTESGLNMGERMKKRVTGPGMLLAGMVLSTTLAGCSSLGRAPEPGGTVIDEAERERAQAPYRVTREDAQELLWQDPDRGWVGLVAAELREGHDLPVRVDDGWLRQALYDLRLWLGGREDDASRVRLINDEVLDVLAPAVAHGLARARPDQAVGFVLASRLGGFNFINPMRLTTGRVFVEGEKLHILFGRVGDQFLEGRRVAIANASIGTRERVLNRKDQVWSRGWGTETLREDWVTAPLETSEAALPELPPSQVPAPAAPAPTAPEPAGQPATTRESGQEEPAVAGLRERLELLQSLHADGLITDEEYDQTRRQLLEQL